MWNLLVIYQNENENLCPFAGQQRCTFLPPGIGTEFFNLEKNPPVAPDWSAEKLAVGCLP